MRNKDYREIQLSSSHLVFIFIGILILGIVIFLLGVSVGKKQAQILASSGTSSLTTFEETKENLTQPEEKSRDSINKELALHEKAKGETASPAIQRKPANIYYVQVGAFADEKAASSFAEKFKEKGFPVLVLPPFASDKKPVYRVRVGGYPSRERAEGIKEELARLKLKRRSDYFIIRK